MNSEYWFGELAGSLQNGFFADSVVLELAKVASRGVVTDEQAGLFQEAAKRLQLAVEGSRWLDDPKMSENASTCAAFFGQAVEAMSLVLTPDAFVRVVEKLIRTSQQLAGKEVPPHDSIQDLRTFFFNAGRTELERTEYLMNGEKEVDKLKWLAAK